MDYPRFNEKYISLNEKERTDAVLRYYMIEKVVFVTIVSDIRFYWTEAGSADLDLLEIG